MSNASAREGRRDLAALYAAAIAGYPLVASVPVAFDLESRAVSVPFRAVVLGLSIWTVSRSVRRRELYTGSLWVPLGIFWVLYLARMLSDTFLRPVPLSQPPDEYFLYAVGTCLVPMLALFTKPSDATLGLALRLTTFVGAVALVTMGYLSAQALLAGEFGGVETGRLELWTLNPISLGHLGASVATLAMFQLRMPLNGPRGSSVALLAAAAIGLVSTGVAASNGPLLALAINFAFLLFLDWRDGHRVRALVCAVVVPFVALQGALYLEQLGFGVISRAQIALDDPTRFELLRGARDQFLAHPILGSSLEERVSLTYPHNSFVESFMAVGVVGGLAYTAFHLTSLRRALGLLIARPASAWLGILCVQYTVSALFSGSLYASNTMWALLAAVSAAAEGPAQSAAVRFPTPLVHPSTIRSPSQ